MIENPENPFELLQNDIATKLMATAPFDGIKFPDGTAFRVLTEDEGDVQFEYDAMISNLGLSIAVKSPEGDIDQPDIPGPLITKMNFEVWVSENPVFNRDELGTKVRLWKATSVVLGALHGFQPPSLASPVYAAKVRNYRERTFASEQDQVGVLILSRRCYFIAPQVAALIT